MTDEIIGRDAELAAVRAFLDQPVDGLRALVLEGEAGIGKSTVWLAAVTAARERAFAVLAARPAETEETLPNLVLGDLLGDLAPEVLATLPAPRRRAVEAALLLREEAGPPVDPRALGVAVVTLLPILAHGQPLVIAIDDDQWMDASSNATLEFALRRLLDKPILLLLSRRTGMAAGTHLEEGVGRDAIKRLHVGPLSVGAVQGLLRHRLGASLSRPMLVRVHEVSGGNPFYALELARAHAGDPARDIALPIALPGSLDRLVGARLDALGPETRRGLLLAAAHGRLPADLLPTLDVARESLRGALDAGVIQRSSGVITFTHPLLASAVYEGATDDERRTTHRLLASALSDPVLVGRHLALGAEGPEAGIADELDSAARIARDRGIPIAAAELAEHALRLTPRSAVDEHHRRAIATARANFEAGDTSRAVAIADDLRAAARSGRRRAEALMLSAELCHDDETLAFFETALLEAADAPELQAAIHAGLADAGRGVRDLAWAERHGLAALRLAERLDDDALRARALSALAAIRYDRGDPRALEMAERAYGLAEQLGDQREMKFAGWSISHMLTWSGLTDRARVWLQSQLTLWGDRDEEARWTTLVYLALVELWAGRWNAAAELAEQAYEISVQYGHPEHFAPMFITLYRGQFTEAKEHARIGLSQTGGRLVPAFPAALGICEMWDGRPAAALPYFREAERMSDARNLDDPNNRWWRAEHVEALLQGGQIEGAEQLLDAWEAAPASVSHARAGAQITHGRGLIAAAHGDLSGASGLLEEAVDRWAAVGDPFGRARALLALGLVRRRSRQKRIAKASLEAALAAFEALGAASWVATTRGELRRIGGRRRIEGLSPSELSVATLVAEGRTNREIAAALFLGERTVASHLTHIYSKLGLRSRTELARHLRFPAETSAEDAIKVPTS